MFDISLKIFTRSALAAIALGISASVSLAAEVADPGNVLKVIVDRAKVVRINRPADTIIIGNPAIVDATIQDSQTLVLTGRSFGVTNLIVMDVDGEPIVDETIIVQAHEQNTVRIYRRASRQTLACSPVCEPTLTIGDNSETFGGALGQINSRNQLSTPPKR